MKISHGVMALCVSVLASHVQANPTFNPNLAKSWAAPYLPEVLEHTPKLKQQVLAVLKQNGVLEDWVEIGFDGGPMVTTPVKPMMTSGATVYTGTFCKPHDCGDTQWIFAYEPKKQALLLWRGDERLFNAAGQDIATPLSDILRMGETLNQLWW